MKLVIDEKLKHHLVGVAVVLSLGAIFLPAMMKKSSQRLENNFSVHVQLPPKPKTPNVVVTNEEEMFKTIKVARIETPALNQKTTELAKEDFIQSVQVAKNAAVPATRIEPAAQTESIAKPIELALSNAANNVVKKQLKTPAVQAVRPVAQLKAKPVRKPLAVAVKPKANPAPVLNKKGIYAVQLASFSKLENAQALVSKLHKKGYKANYIRIAGKQGAIYKVYAGHSPVRSDVMKLKNQLASAMQLNGFVVNTGVS
ncbi:SPOR domain-containing protein [Fluoribacter dumoffii]|uniref:Cell division protein DedD n=1 Tax=Fluoribacter dumoffii TaxID=463 RepID=A0A377G9W2_9GAMM|nr:SPOR domain-containing protein [Fluoribacter dumoffii]KTC90050.1 Sporulation domain-containing protein [Fluoribacter dumoffii NY 23]MCW8385349.1 SPOR domain-containing protein [Fluoribacter dumoffii]MCW8496354.1 SPOR domain-containing protein [Fluoribacter dumoffii]STO21168.1 cell division protein DedD [Fluoribacter dumoffii]